MKTNRKITKLMSSALAVSILQSSCTQYIDKEDDFIYEKPSHTNDGLGKIAIPMAIDLSKEEVDYINFLQELSNNIIKNPSVAREFSKNPTSFAKKYGYNEEINLEEGVLKLVLALGDEDINNAIKSNNVKEFYRLCKEKELLDVRMSFLNKNFHLKNISNNEDFQKQFQKMGIQEQEAEAFFYLIPAVAIAIAAAVAVVYVVAYDEFAVAGDQTIIKDDDILNERVREIENSGIIEETPTRSIITEEQPILNIWALKEKRENTRLVVNTLMEEQIDETISFIREKSPSYFEKNSEEDLRNTLRLNILKMMNK